MKMKGYSRPMRLTAFLLTFTLLSQPFGGVAWALTSGPRQPEFEGFTPAGSSEMVNLFTGDFNYSIPIFEIPGPNGGYPLNLSYNAGITMDQEAGWVGLGWSLSPGSVNRSVRGLPDDFSGDKVEKKSYRTPDRTLGVEVGVSGSVGGSEAASLSLGANLSIYHNSYKGLGVTKGVNLSAKLAGAFTIGVGYSHDNHDGISINPSVGISTSESYMDYANIGLSGNYNSRSGLTGISLNMGVGTKSEGTRKKTGDAIKSQSGISSSTPLTFFSSGYTPSIGFPTVGKSVEIKVSYVERLSNENKAGVSLNGFWRKTEFDNTEDVPSYGYLYNHLASSENKGIMDFNREKDGKVHDETPFLPIPTQTYDIYSVSGQGVSAMYRPFRKDIGILTDRLVSSRSSGKNFEVEFGVLSGNIGGGYGQNESNSVSGGRNRQGENSGLWDMYKFLGDDDLSLQGELSPSEAVYFKSYGEPGTDPLNETAHISKEKPVRFELEKNGLSVNVKPVLVDKQGGNQPVSGSVTGILKEEGGREARSTQILPVYNKDIQNGKGNSLFNIDVVSKSGHISGFNRNRVLGPYAKSLYANHIAGFVVLNPAGLRYVYALPAYNTVQKEVQFSTNRTDALNNLSSDAGIVKIKTENIGGYNEEVAHKVGKSEHYLNRSSTPPYAHSYLLTSIVGQDYVDSDGIEGPSEGDLGYWVKFTYQNTEDDYKWRAPFVGASYGRGFHTDLWDDKGSYMYGSKEVWYLKKAETRSHVAVFELNEREDGRGARSEFQSEQATSIGAAQQCLKSVTLFTRPGFESGKPLQKAVFDYDYSLCPGVFNNKNIGDQDEGTGKLTLKSLWFEYGSSTKKMNPYTFEYGINPSYSQYNYDRWGNYLPYNESADNGELPGAEANRRLYNMENPYVPQDERYRADKNLDAYAGAWALDKIHTPSGGVISIEYEPDDYAYVQNKQAMQMTKISSVGKLDDQNNSLLYWSGKYSDEEAKRLYFKLASPIAVEGCDEQKEIDRYLARKPDGSYEPLYFKVKINTMNKTGFWEYVSGYAEVVGGANGLAGNKTPLPDGVEVYTHGYVTIKPIVDKPRHEKYHPFSLASWQHLRLNQPDLLNLSETPPISIEEEAEQDKKKLGKLIRALFGATGEMDRMINGLYPMSKSLRWGRQIMLGHSFIRLNNPDKKKIGGGYRVKKIAISDSWSEMGGGQTFVTGTEYVYRTEEGFSSGVAAYEPSAGGDENALRQPHSFVQKVPLRVNLNLISETPINESLYPAPGVGYSRVLSRSLASSEGKYRGSGVAVNEFYTAKDFPVITDYTQVKSMDAKQAVPALFFSSNTHNYTATQGFVTILNDMHGKPKSVASYPFGKSSVGISGATSYVRYDYLTKEGNLYNVVDALVSDNGKAGAGSVEKEKRVYGQDEDFFVDYRYFDNYNYSFGFSGGIVGFMPYYSQYFRESAQTVKLAVTNKVIHKTGVLVKTTAYDGQAKAETENVLWDAQTGEVLMTRTYNEFHDPVYSYSLPARFRYDKMGSAHKNLGMRFETSLERSTAENIYSCPAPGSWGPYLTEGDEFIIGGGTAEAVYVGKKDGKHCFYSEKSIEGAGVRFFLFRSGMRNVLEAKAMGLTGFKDPTEIGNRRPVSKETEVQIPSSSGSQSISY
jgi:hypothetical protein